MKNNFWKVIVLGTAICGFTMQLTSRAQSVPVAPDKHTAGQGSPDVSPVQSALLELPAADGPETKSAKDSTTPSSGSSTSAAAASARSAAATPESDTTSATPASVSLKNDAVIKELADMKKQFDQVTQMQAAIKARIGKLELELDTNPATGDSVSAEKDASTLRSAESGNSSDSAAVGQAAAPTPAVAPAPPEMDAQVTKKGEPFPGDWTWLNSNGHAVDSPMSTKYFTPEFRADANYILDYNHPEDDTMGGATESFRSDEWQLEQISVGGDFRINNVRGRILTMNGLFSTTTPRNDASVNRGNWDLSGAYKYVSEAWGGYHWDVNHGLNVDAGIFVSYIGLFSYYNFDNWAYQPSYVSSNTPWFFNGLRIQWFPTNKLKIEPWIINGWQSYGRIGSRPGLGGQILYRPAPWISMVFNNYGMGEDTLGAGNGRLGRTRIHTDDSVEIKYYDHPEKFLDKMAFSLTGDLGCEYGGGVSCFGDTKDSTGAILTHKQAFLGWMLYNRWQFKKDTYGLTIGGGAMNNPGRYLVLVPPINGADAISGTPYFTANPGDPFKAWDTSITFDYMPKQYITFRWEYGYRHANVPYFSGRGGITPGVNSSPSTVPNLAAGSLVPGTTFVPGPFLSPTPGSTCVAGPGFCPDLRKDEASIRMA